MSHQFPHIFALKEEVIVFTECHKQVSDVFSFVSAEFNAVEVSLGYFELVSDVIDDLSRFEVKQL